MGNCFGKKPSGGGCLPPGDPSKRAVVVGCNYSNSKHQLNGCVRDAEAMAQLLVQHYRFCPQNVVVLRDDARDARLRPTRANIENALRWLMRGAKPGDSLVFHFSGHGTLIKDTTGEEPDGFCNALLPEDHARAGVLVDKLLNRLLVGKVPAGVQLFAVVDACHSGTVLDLPCCCRRKFGREKWRDTFEGRDTGPKGTAGGRAVQIPAACDVQKAVDTAKYTGQSQGAATYAFLAAVHANKGQISWGELLQLMHKVLDPNDKYGIRPKTGKLGSAVNSVLSARGFEGQSPMLSTDTEFDLRTPFGI